MKKFWFIFCIGFVFSATAEIVLDPLRGPQEEVEDFSTMMGEGDSDQPSPDIQFHSVNYRQECQIMGTHTRGQFVQTCVIHVPESEEGEREEGETLDPESGVALSEGESAEGEALDSESGAALSESESEEVETLNSEDANQEDQLAEKTDFSAEDSTQNDSSNPNKKEILTTQNNPARSDSDSERDFIFHPWLEEKTFTQDCTILNYYSKNRNEDSDEEEGRVSSRFVPTTTTSTDCVTASKRLPKNSEIVAEDASPEGQIPEDSVMNPEEPTIEQEFKEEEIVFPPAVEVALDGIGKIVLEMKPTEQIIGMGSGFFIKDEEGRIKLITNYHVFAPYIKYITQLNLPDEHLFTESLALQMYLEQGDQRYRVIGVTDLSVTMDLAVLEVENYTGPVLELAQQERIDLPAYALGYPSGEFQKIKAELQIELNSLYDSFMVVHDMEYCRSLQGLSGSPLVNAEGQVVGVSASGAGGFQCIELNTSKLSDLKKMNFNRPLIQDKESLVRLILEEESVFYNHVLLSEHEADFILRARTYTDQGLILSDMLNPIELEDLTRIYESLVEEGATRQWTPEEQEIVKFFIQKNMMQTRGSDVQIAADLGSPEAQQLMGGFAYAAGEYEKAYDYFSQVIQSKNPLFVYSLSMLYYRSENNPEQACRLLEWAKEDHISALNQLYSQYECTEVLGYTH